MPSLVTIVMYHFVRDLGHSRYPGIKGLDLARFRNQLDHVVRHYTPVRMEDVLAAADGQPLPRDAILLTFDDGYIDHYVNVFPLLDAAGVQGSFFPPAKAIAEHQVLDVNKLHFVLACARDPHELVEFVCSAVDARRTEFDLDGGEEYYARVSGESRYDSADVTFVKRMLQRELPESLRAELTDKLFHQHVTTDEAAFSRELYMNRDQLMHLVRAGMFVGSHGYDHYWLNSLPVESQEREIDRSLEFLESIRANTRDWVMCYPYGGYDESLLDVLRDRDCRAGLTTRVAVADMASDPRLELPRLDTNDLPQTAAAEHAGSTT